MTTTVESRGQAERSDMGWRTLTSLARFEGLRMILNPVLWIGAVGAVLLAVLELWELSPVLNQVSVTLAWTMFPLAAAVAIAAGWAVIRARGRSDADPPTVMPMGIEMRVAGIILGLAWSTALTLLIQASLLVWLYTRNPVTSVVWAELASGPIYVVFAGVLSVMLTRWFSHPSTPVISVLVLLALVVVGPYDPTTWGRVIGLEWLKPLVWPQSIIPYEVAFRPAALHLGYLAGLAAVLAGLAVVGRGKAGWVVLGLGLGVSVLFGSSQMGPITAAQRGEAITALVGDGLECETRGPASYCTMPGYENWVDDWQQALEPVLTAAAPPALDGLEVRQYPAHNEFLLDGQDYNDWWWIEPSYLDFERRDVVPVGSQMASWKRADVARAASAWIADCPIYGDCPSEGKRVLTLWLMTQNPEIRAIVVENVGGGEHTQVAECMTVELWDQPDAASKVITNWETLIDPETTYEQAGEVLGVPVPSGPREQGDVLPRGCS